MLEKTFSYHYPHSDLKRIAVHPSLNLLASIGKITALIFICTDKLYLYRQITDENPDEDFYCCCFKDSYLLVAGRLGVLKMINVYTLKVDILSYHGSSINDIVVHDGWVFACSSDGTIGVYRDRLCYLFVGHEDVVLSMDVSLCGRYLVSSGTDCMIKVWNLEVLDSEDSGVNDKIKWKVDDKFEISKISRDDKIDCNCTNVSDKNYKLDERNFNDDKLKNNNRYSNNDWYANNNDCKNNNGYRNTVNRKNNTTDDTHNEPDTLPTYSPENLRFPKPCHICAKDRLNPHTKKIRKINKKCKLSNLSCYYDHSIDWSSVNKNLGLCSSDPQTIKIIHRPIFSSQYLHSRYIKNVSFLGKFIVSASRKKLMVVSPFYGTVKEPLFIKEIKYVDDIVFKCYENIFVAHGRYIEVLGCDKLTFEFRIRDFCLKKRLYVLYEGSRIDVFKI